MSAIGGIIHLEGKPVDRATMDRMLSALTPYGQDAQNQIHLGQSAFLRTLLRTTPEDSLDQQPLHHRESNSVLMFDGRIDNRKELAEALRIKASELKLMPDSALVLRALLKWDTNALVKLRGDFALAFWGVSKQRLLLARDPLGFRPLFWVRKPWGLAFATMPKGLFCIPGISTALDEESVHDFLCLLPMTGERSFFHDINRVKPAHGLLWEDGKVIHFRYFTFNKGKELRLPSDENYVDALRDSLHKAVARRLRVAGPVGTHLSSGLDSSTVTAFAATQLAESNRKLVAYTASPREDFTGPVPKGRHWNEAAGARLVASRFPNIEHVVIRTGGRSPIKDLGAFTEQMQQPVLNPTNFSWSKAIDDDATDRGIRVLLKGGMGNLTISYPGMPVLQRCLAQGHLLEWWQEAKRRKRQTPNRPWRALLVHSAMPLMPGFLWRRVAERWGLLTDITSIKAINPELMKRMNTIKRSRSAGWDLSYQPPRNGRRMRVDSITRLDSGQFYAGLNAQGLEHRDPTADVDLIELCLSIPEKQYRTSTESKWLLKRVMTGILPEEVIHSETRGLQAADWFEDFERSLPEVSRHLEQLQHHPRAGEYLSLKDMAESITGLPTSGWDTQEVYSQYRLKLLRGLAVGCFISYSENRNE